MNPFVKNKKSLAIYIFIWLFVAILQTAILFNILNFEIKPSLTDSLIFNFIYALLGLSFWYSIKYVSLEKLSVLKILTNHITAAVISSILWVMASSWVLSKIFSLNDNYTNFLYTSLVWRFFIGVLFYAVIISLYYVVLYYSNFQQKVLEEAELKTLVKEAELKSLKYQINPHFIFNSLNSISALTMVKPELAQEMTIMLSSFLRQTLSNNDSQFNTLEDEITNAKLYLGIEKIRFDDRLSYTEIVEENCKTIQVPSMILQPLFENSIKHGLYESTDIVNVKLHCQKEKEYFKIVVENNFDKNSSSIKGEGIGLNNIKNRLEKIYKQNNLLLTQSEEGVFKTTIYIPIEAKLG
ncbi:MAG: histidine kinase [Melioribacteraceae bacterium]